MVLGVVRFTDHEMDALAYLLWEQREVCAARLYTGGVEPSQEAAVDRLNVLCAKIARVTWQPRDKRILAAYQRSAARRSPAVLK